MLAQDLAGIPQLAIIAEVLDQLFLDLDYQIVYQVEFVAFSLSMKVIVSQFDLLWLTYIELSLESRGEIILIAPSLLQQIDEYDAFIVIHEPTQVAVECLYSQLRTPFDRCMSLQASLLPEQRHRSSYLNVGEEKLGVYYDLFSLYEVRHVSVII